MVAFFGLETTELKRSLEALDDAQAESEKMIRLKEAFLQNVSHELRTPLTGIIGFAQVIKNEVPKQFYEFIDNIDRSGRRLMDSLNGMLDMAGLQAENIVLSPRVIDLVDEVEAIVQGLASNAKEKDIFLKVKAISPEVLLYVDLSSLHRILHNLISNAIKFTETGGVIVEISQASQQAHCRILDSGIGIDESFMAQLFDEFYQEESASDRSYEGLGLGLAVTKRLVRMLGGTIDVQSTKGEGTMFTISFPLALSLVNNTFTHPPVILVADRNPETVRLAHFLLDDILRVDEANTLDQVLSRIAERSYNLILVDLSLEQGVDDAALLTQIRSQDGYSDVPVVALVSKQRLGELAQFSNIGFAQYLQKPFTKLTLLNVLTELLTPTVPAADSLLSADYQ